MTRRRAYKWRFTKTVFKGLVRKAQLDAERDELLVKLSAAAPRAVYCSCLDFAIRSGSQKAAGYAAHLFLEIFGAWPRSCDRGPPAPLPDFLIEQWVALRKKKPWRITVEKPAPLIDRLTEKPSSADADGFVEGTLMRPGDFAVRWHDVGYLQQILKALEDFEVTEKDRSNGNRATRQLRNFVSQRRENERHRPRLQRRNSKRRQILTVGLDQTGQARKVSDAQVYTESRINKNADRSNGGRKSVLK